MMNPPVANRLERRFNSRLRFARYEVGVAGRRGLAGMAGRAALYGGTVGAGPASDGGRTVYATPEGSRS
jgi:hypothetical protein